MNKKPKERIKMTNKRGIGKIQPTTGAKEICRRQQISKQKQEIVWQLGKWSSTSLLPHCPSEKKSSNEKLISEWEQSAQSGAADRHEQKFGVCLLQGYK